MELTVSPASRIGTAEIVECYLCDLSRAFWIGAVIRTLLAPVFHKAQDERRNVVGQDIQRALQQTSSGPPARTLWHKYEERLAGWSPRVDSHRLACHTEQMKDTPQASCRPCQKEGFVASKKAVATARKQGTNDRIVSPISGNAFIDEYGLYERVSYIRVTIERLRKPITIRST